MIWCKIVNVNLKCTQALQMDVFGKIRTSFHFLSSMLVEILPKMLVISKMTTIHYI